jgi:hypothetical protein
MSTFTYTIRHADGTIENRTGKVRVAKAAVNPRTDIEEGEAKIVTNAARVLRRGVDLETAAMWFSSSPQFEVAPRDDAAKLVLSSKVVPEFG